jgi:hypothetical protein
MDYYRDGDKSIQAGDVDSIQVGGGKVCLTYGDLAGHILSSNSKKLGKDVRVDYLGQTYKQDGQSQVNKNPLLFLCQIPLNIFANGLTLSQARGVCRSHHIFYTARSSVKFVRNLLAQHVCTEECSDLLTLFAPSSAKAPAERQEKWYKGLTKAKRKKRNIISGKIRASRKKNAPYHIKRQFENRQSYRSYKFPPLPPKDTLLHQVIDGFCTDTNPSKFVEHGCAVCGQLTLNSELVLLSHVQCDFEVLRNIGVSCLERKSESDPLMDIQGPILDPDCKHICSSCHTQLLKGLAPLMSLANGLWLGKVPEELSCLTYVEKLLISRIRHNRCIIRVASSGRYKMKANAVSFQNPIPKIYSVLPPPIEELDEVLAFIYTGPCQPTKKDLERTPLLVRRTQVGKALKWLKLNHCDYQSIDISDDNLRNYPEGDVPVVIDYRQSTINKDKEATSVHDNDDDEGVEHGKCPFVVHGLTGEEFSTMRLDTIKAHALEHLMSDGKILLIGHSEHPQSIYKNPQLFPAMMPWLFPYGLGGIGQTRHEGMLSSMAHKKHLLMYHDKRFQTDPSFPLIALNHEQIKECTTGGYLTSRKNNFSDVTDRLLNVDVAVLADLKRRLDLGEVVRPETDAEKLCYRLINDLDVVGGHVKGSATSKKYMRNEIWSLISFIGAPSWFITFSPADNKHPICLYFADKDEEFKPEIMLPDDAYRLVAQNPVAAARFFHFMCNTFIEHVLGVGKKRPGLFGKTSAYYGTVEQQGRLTLHMHLLLWIQQSLSPQEVRDRIMDRTSDFQKLMVEYLEGVHVGEFFEGSLAEVKSRVKEAEKVPGYVNPTKSMPDPPPPACEDKACSGCSKCSRLLAWWNKFKNTVDDLICRSNVHTCITSVRDKEGKEIKKACLNREGQCRARFPREVVSETMVDPLTGALKIKKGEPWLNTFTPTITYLLRCNTDVTSLLSGTAIKAVVGYITDYVTKTGLSTYSVFDTIRQTFDRNSEMTGGSLDRKEAARKLMTKIVNGLTAKMEIGSPMACLYLLGNPDHYTGHNFVNFYWKNYVREARSVWFEDLESEQPEKVVLNKNMGKYVGLSTVQDYTYRPRIYDHLNLYEWIQTAKKSKRNKADMKAFNEKHEQKELSKSSQDAISDNEAELDLISADENAPLPITPVSKPEVTESNAIPTCFLDYEDACCNDGEDVFGMLEEDDDEHDDELNIGDARQYFEEEEREYEFISTHPQWKTHHIHCDETASDNVPNFIGGTLPRSDQGDREYYCSTMLTLFKPWRSGQDLKTGTQTWDESFLSHQFTAHQNQLMLNFNLRYECNDARDDYSAKIKKDTHKGGFFASWATQDTLGELDNTMKNYEDDEHVDSENPYLSCDYSPENDKIIRQMDEIERIVKNAGWLDKWTGSDDDIDQEEFKPSVDIPGSKWRAVVQAAKHAILCERNKNVTSVIHKNPDGQPNHDEVRIGDISHLRKNYRAEQSKEQAIIDTTVIDFELNAEQERAFRIVANHATSKKPQQLKMYLGGMGGTGKSQVLKALTSFFVKRNELHRIMILAPTGTAAALINGSTIHSVLGIPIDNVEILRSEFTVLAQVRARLEGVEYIFLDEVSMVSCHLLYKISAQLAKARNIVDVPFGGVNIIFAGDFAQLAPVGGSALYSSLVGTFVDASQTVRGQQSAIGKALWHQVTTVVILRENMRQTTQTEDDAKLRTALENMRYAACTANDIRYLRTRIAGRRHDQPRLADKCFRDVSIITAWNSHKDRLNQLGCERFASETKQKLTHFYSVDTLGKCEDPAVKKRRGRKKGAPIKDNKIGAALQDMLWNLRHSATGQIAGKLSLCIGMPIMIKNNDATELCITKGQEGHVVGWQSSIGSAGQLVLDTLFVKLYKPARAVKIEGLPNDVVPLTRIGKTVECVCLNDSKLFVSRSQANVLPNFAMTDYASQGKTRPFNIVDLSHCRDHTSYYTCLSRSASSEGTVLIQGFDERKITGGTSGHLRQEFREHEILDEISRHLYDGTLPAHINGHLRNSLIRQYQLHKGTTYVPVKTPEPLTWSKAEPFGLLPVVTDTPWQIIVKTKKKREEGEMADIARTVKSGNKKKSASHTFIAAAGSTMLHSSTTLTDTRKRKIDVLEDVVPDKADKKPWHAVNNNVPVGMKWDEANYSCAYDALFSILCNIWIYKRTEWSTLFKSLSIYMATLSNGYASVLKGKSNLEAVRDRVRKKLHMSDQNMFPYGHLGTNIGDLAMKMLDHGERIKITSITCEKCGKDPISTSVDLVINVQDVSHVSLTEWFKNWQNQPNVKCRLCKSSRHLFRHFDQAPKLLAFNLNEDLGVSEYLQIKNGDGSFTSLALRGIVYAGGFHFTSRIISPDKNVWYHDGITSQKTCAKDGHMSDYTMNSLLSCRQRKAILLVYAH